MGKSALVPHVRQGSVQPKAFDLIPGPSGQPIIGSLMDYIRKDGFKFNTMFLAMESRAKEYGPIVFEEIADFSHVIVSDPFEYEKVIHVDGKYPHRIEMEPMAHYKRKRNLCLGTVNSQGQEWYRHRTVLNKKLLSPKEIKSYIAPVDEVANDFIRRLQRLAKINTAIPNIEHELFKWAMESIGSILFEERIGCFEEPTSPFAESFIKNLLGFFHHLQPLMYGLPLYKIWPTKDWKLFQKYFDNLHFMGLEFVTKKTRCLLTGNTDSGRKTSEFLTFLLSQKALTPDEANLHAVELMMGAVETTANAMQWTLYCLGRNPEAQENAYRESLTVNTENITSETIPKIPFIKSCLKEAFRLFPITFATSRIIKEDIELGGYYVPAGTHVQANLYGMGRNEKYFTHAHQYEPGRWMDRDNEHPRFVSSLPFGHGARMCLGRRVAEIEIYVALTKIVRNFRIIHKGPEVLPVLKTVMTPDRPLNLEFIPRSCY